MINNDIYTIRKAQQQGQTPGERRDPSNIPGTDRDKERTPANPGEGRQGSRSGDDRGNGSRTTGTDRNNQNPRTGTETDRTNSPRR